MAGRGRVISVRSQLHSPTPVASVVVVLHAMQLAIIGTSRRLSLVGAEELKLKLECRLTWCLCIGV
jgi:hypothetical protein